MHFYCTTEDKQFNFGLNKIQSPNNEWNIYFDNDWIKDSNSIYKGIDSNWCRVIFDNKLTIKHNKLRVKIFTNLKKLDFFYNKSDLFVSTSLYEGLPTTMIEAASYRLPIISSNFKSGAAEILSNGKSGFLFKLRDYKKLSKLIEDFYNNPKIFLQKEKNCRRNLNRFSVKKNTKLFNHLVQSLI